MQRPTPPRKTMTAIEYLRAQEAVFPGHLAAAYSRVTDGRYTAGNDQLVAEELARHASGWGVRITRHAVGSFRLEIGLQKLKRTPGKVIAGQVSQDPAESAQAAIPGSQLNDLANAIKANTSAVWALQRLLAGKLAAGEALAR